MSPVDKTVILGCAPMDIFGHPAKLRDMGVCGVVNMCSEYSGPSGYAGVSITQLHLPCVDHFEPSVSQYEEAVKFIQEHHDKGSKVYVHCKAGHGRGAAIALAWLVSQNSSMSAKVSCTM